jgi:hypothetical protein
VPTATFPLLGWMATEINAGVATVTSVVPVVLFRVAEIVAVPRPRAASRPLEDTCATDVLVEDHVVMALRSWVEPSLNAPVATNCRNTPCGMVLLTGVTMIESRSAFVTVRLADAESPLIEAMMTALPPALPAKASPLLFTLATVGWEELHVTWLEIFWVMPFVKVPVAVNCWSVYLAIFASAGVTVNDFRDAAPTVRTVEALRESREAEICVVP